MHDLLLKNARVVDPANRTDRVTDVAVDGGKIAGVGDCLGTARKTVGLDGLVLTPGIIDPHLHLGPMFGSSYGQRMAALSGVTTCLDMAGPAELILRDSHAYGCGINVAMLEGFSPMAQFGTESPDTEQIDRWIEDCLRRGALGVKVLGGHWPVDLDVEAKVIMRGTRLGAYAAWHAGSRSAGSNIEGMREVFESVGDAPLHLAHINAYCRGRVNPVAEEALEAIRLLNSHPNAWSESYVSPMNGTSLACDPAYGRSTDHVTCNCLRTFGYSTDAKGLEQAMLDGKLFVVNDNGRISELVGGKQAVAVWKAHGTDIPGSFPVNPSVSRFLLAQAKRPDGSFVVDAICTDGGCIPRNVIISTGLSLVRFGALTLSEFVVKASLNAARHLRLAGKGHLSEGADADITVFDLEAQKPLMSWVAGQAVLDHGSLPGKGTHFICHPKGAGRIRAEGFSCTAVTRDEPEPPRFIP